MSTVQPLAALLGAWLAVATPAAAQERIATGPDLTRNGWMPVIFRNREPTRFEPDGAHALRVIAQSSSSMLSRSVDIDPRADRCLTWRWILDESTIPATDLGQRGGDDRNLIVSVGFAFDAERASLGERMRFAAARTAAGREIPGRVLFYVWGGRHPRGAWVKSPYMDGAGVIRVIEPSPGPTGRWLEARADLAADFRAQFGAEPTRVVELAVGGDSDDTRTRSVGRISDLAFSRGCAP
jgi:hypothetical protein